MIPSGWVRLKGSEISSKITKGSSPKWQGFEYQNDGCLFVTSENVRDGFLDITSPKFLPLEFNKKLKNSQLYKGDILINIVGASIGRSCLLVEDVSPANINQAVCLVRLNDGISKEYVSYFLQAPHVVKKLVNTQTDSARPNLSLEDIRKFEFMVPPIKEQEKIVSILSTWDMVIQLLTSKLEKLKCLRRTHLSSLVLNCKHAVQSTVLNDVAELINGRAYKISEWEEDGIPVIRLQNLTGSGDKFYYSNLDLPDDKFCSKGDILYMWSATFGPYIWQGPKAIYHYHIWKVLPRPDKIEKDYLYFLLLAYTELWKQKTVGSTMAHLTKEKMEKVLVKLPSLNYQKKISAYFSSLDQEVEANEKLLKNMILQKQGLMQQLLTGKKRVKV